MITYSTNFMGPVSIEWYRERGLTCKATRVLTAECPLVISGYNQAGDIFEFDDITVQCCGGRIDIRDSAKSGYDGWDEYSIAPMVEEDWHALGEYLWDLETETQLSYEQLIEGFELWYGKSIRWME